MAATDHPLKRLVTMAAVDFATWLLGQPVLEVTTRQGQLSSRPQPIDADLIFLVTLVDGTQVILHIEFQGLGTKRPMHLRMLDYIARLALTYPDLPVYSVVIYLGGAGASDTGDHHLDDPSQQPYIQWHYHVVHLWQMPGEDLLALQRPALLPLLGQTRLQNAQQTMAQAVQQIAQHTTGERRSLLLTELLLLCHDTEVADMLEQMIIQEYGIPETPMMRKLREQGRKKGLEEGREKGLEEGREKGQEQVVLHLLQRRCGPLDALTTDRVQQLDSEHLLLLADALLDFQGPADLHQWLDAE